MKGVWLVALIASAALSGCAAGDANPNLATPKLVVAPRAGGNATIFIHSAFGEHAYEWIRLDVDNATLLNQTGVFSVEETLPNGFYLEAWAEVGEAVYALRARIDLFPVEERASVSFVDEKGEWSSEAESFRLPFERLIERRAEP